MKHYGLGLTNNLNHFFSRIYSRFKVDSSCGMMKLSNCITILFFLLIGTTAHSQITDYYQLNDQDQANLSRWLGWVWGDGIPNNLADSTGIKYTGPSANRLPEFDKRYNEFTESLAAVDLGMILANGGTNTRRIREPWDYWIDAIPGGNIEDSDLLRDVVKNPNFLAGIIDTEGGRDNGLYYIDDHFYAPSHPDTRKGWGLRNFGPNRMIQLYHLLGDTYGFGKTFMEVGKNGTFYTYNNQTERETAISSFIDKYNSSKAMNENGNANLFRVRVYIHSDDWETLRSYGYWIPPARYPRSGGDLVILEEGDQARADLENVDESEYVLLQHKSTNKLLRSDIELTASEEGDATLWKLIDIGNGYFRIASKADNLWLRAISNKLLQTVPDTFQGHQTQWKIKELSNGSYLITNRWKYGNNLRVNSQIYVRHGSSGATAHWNIIGLN